MITLVQEVEDNLVELIRLSGGARVERADGNREPGPETDVMSGVGPMVPGVDTGGGAVSDQDEVDDLLSSLGF